MLAVLSILCALCSANPQAVIKLKSSATADDTKESKLVLTSAPEAWLGVRMSPVPDALKVHVGRGGLMIGNVVVDSPADKAGLERYDVVVSFDGKAIEEMDDLLKAIADAGQGQAVEMVVIRKGKETKLTVTPGEWPEAGEWEYKYDEPEDEVLDDKFIFRGHRLHRGPGGGFIFQPLGQLKDLPEPLQKFRGPWDESWGEWEESWKQWAEAWKHWGESWKALEGAPFDLELHIDADEEGKLALRFDSGGEAQGEMEIRIITDCDGEKLMIHRTKDGKITVERTDKDGGTSSGTYDGAEQLKEDDPEAYELYKGFGYGHRHTMILSRPDLKDLPKLQKRYQKQIQLRLGDAQTKIRVATEQAGRAVEDANRTVRVLTRALPPGASAEADLDITVADDGSISVSLRKGDTRVIYEFKGKDDFKEREPELFEKFRDALE